MRRYIPESQRKLCQAMQEHGFREKAKEAGDDLIGVELENMLKQMRVSALSFPTIYVFAPNMYDDRDMLTLDIYSSSGPHIAPEFTNT